ncbi:hypothetical protein ACIBI7_35820 [Nonomuraea fuscirosea]|uniref:hypothetical protein n=1 Tax=Nonomuraea fuscirosea TaxID=1291556 RepID=UPI0037ADB7C0
MKYSWNVPEDFWVIQRRARWMRTLRIEVQGEPEQKGARGKRTAVAFQQQVIERMTSLRRRPFNGPVALDLHFKSTRRNPPTIQRLAKHALDVLGKADPTIRAARPSVLYRDDRQVKFLYVDLDQGWNRDREFSSILASPGDLPDPWALADHQQNPGPPSSGELVAPWLVDLPMPLFDKALGIDGAAQQTTGSTYLVARPGRDVLADLTLANRLRHVGDEDDEDDESSPFWAPDLPLDLAEDEWTSRTPAPDEDSLWEYFDQSSRFSKLMRFQETVLAQIDAHLLWGLCLYIDSAFSSIPPNCPEDYRHTFGGHIRDSQAMARQQLLRHPLALRLPALPRTSHEGEEFASALRQQMLNFRLRRPMFKLLTVPVKVTFLVVPPEQGKDLDNIALTALPIVHEVLRPHIEPHIVLAPSHPQVDPAPWREEALRRLKSLNANSVTAYQVIELPRTAQDPPEGVLSLALGSATHQSWWERIADHVDKRIEDADDPSEWNLRA